MTVSYSFKTLKNVVFLVIGGMLVFGFVIKYIECNRSLEAGNLADIFDFSSYSDNPCSDDWKNKEKTMWNMWGLLISQPTKAQCLSYLEQKYKLRLPYCRPDHVLFSYLNEVILFQFKLTVETTTRIFKEINSSIPFPYNIVASIIFGLTLMQFLKLVFVYIISPKNYLSNWWWNSDLPQQSSGGSSNTIQPNTADKLSGKNLDILFELIKDYTQLKFQTSGVQVIDHITHEETNVDNKKEEISEFSQHQENNEEDITLLKVNKKLLNVTSESSDREMKFKIEAIEDKINNENNSYTNLITEKNCNCQKSILDQNSNDNKNRNCNEKKLEESSNENNETIVNNKKEEISESSQHQENNDKDITLLKINKTKLHLTSNIIDREINFKREEIEDITNKDMTSFLNDNNNFNSNKKILEGSSNENKIGDCNKNILEQNSNDSINCNCDEEISEESRNEDNVESNCGKDIKEIHFESTLYPLKD